MKLLFWDDSVATVVITYGILFTCSKTWAIHFLLPLVFVAKFARGLAFGEKIPPSSVYLFRWFILFHTKRNVCD